MNISRRNLFKGVAGLTAGLLLPSTVQENAETARRYWSLDRTMVPSDNFLDGFVLPDGFFDDVYLDKDWTNLDISEMLWAYEV